MAVHSSSISIHQTIRITRNATQSFGVYFDLTLSAFITQPEETIKGDQAFKLSNNMLAVCWFRSSFRSLPGRGKLKQSLIVDRADMIITGIMKL